MVTQCSFGITGGSFIIQIPSQILPIMLALYLMLLASLKLC